ncbi:hypothetical protein H257_03949 [Aphanomyces astaci]|uniref:Uncharacterized protein n=1 Tax=Aphanomyces astaci TaxID=112090 RepID=W4GV17_APHAT|nr:hypothetical protein H257_03949 [Aphanomyces astaci]ETV83146.1 hypothetical protein H257_03949 [Aphanomyces astaci]|eukprot:XP_009826576.1 hypothetical protein H257_03949 [Aphanomyces astaci]
MARRLSTAMVVMNARLKKFMGERRPPCVDSASPTPHHQDYETKSERIGISSRHPYTYTAKHRSTTQRPAKATRGAFKEDMRTDAAPTPAIYPNWQRT